MGEGENITVTKNATHTCASLYNGPDYSKYLSDTHLVQVDYREFIYELLDLPLPRHVAAQIPVPRRSTRAPLGPRTKQLMEMLRAQVE